MTIADNVNSCLSVVSIVVTIISIVCSIVSFLSARNAKKYKEETLKFKDTIDLNSLLGKFRNESQNYQDRTRRVDWYRGQDSSLIISPFNNVLLSFGEYYPLMKDEKAMKAKVHSLQEAIQNDSTFTNETQKTINRLITDIIELLQTEIREMTTGFIQSSN